MHTAVRVAVSLVVQDARGCVLLTKRGEAMRKFPGAWVIPGGHLDPYETVLCLLLCPLPPEREKETGVDEEKYVGACGWKD